jgi:CheY-like chemotaxis protein
LTAATAQQMRDETVRQVPASPLGGKVLLVDDVRDDALLLAEVLDVLNASIEVAGSVEEALAILDETTIDLVVTDLNMPLANGLDLARELRKRQDTPALIFVTGSQCPRDKATAFELGAVAYLQKPVNIAHFIGLVRDTLRSHRAKRAS